MSAIAGWIADRLPANTDLTPKQAGEVACELRGAEGLWRSHVRHDETLYGYHPWRWRHARKNALGCPPRREMEKNRLRAFERY